MSANRIIFHSLPNSQPLQVGWIVETPDNREVLIIDGQYERNGRVSNFWRWREINHDDSLGEVEKGYGWFVDKKCNYLTTINRINL